MDSTCATLRDIVSDAKTKIKVPASISDVDKTPVAKDIWCYSTKEKTFTWHVVVNHDANGFVDRVQCKISKVIHKYKRQNKPATTPVNKTTKPRKIGSRTPVKAVDTEEMWYRGVRNWSDTDIIPYSPATHFKTGDVFEHPSFGKGVVLGRRDNKIDVVFKTGTKILLSAK